MPIANGLALAPKIRGDNRVTIANFGDGASNIGAFHEALNMASVWKLPVVFVCQNNGYAEHTKMAAATSVPNIAIRAVSYGMPGVTVDGNDPLAMYATAKDAIDRARNGGGPTLVEAKTFRFFGHNLGDQDGYMDKGEKELWKARDPVPAFRKWLIATNLATEAEFSALKAAIEAEIEEALAFTLASPYPEIAELRRDVFEAESSL